MYGFILFMSFQTHMILFLLEAQIKTLSRIFYANLFHSDDHIMKCFLCSVILVWYYLHTIRVLFSLFTFQML